MLLAFLTTNTNVRFRTRPSYISRGCYRVLGSSRRGQVAVFEQITAPASSIINAQCFQGLFSFPTDTAMCKTRCARASDLTDSSSWEASRLTCNSGVTVVGYFDFFTPTGTCNSISSSPSDTTTTVNPTSEITATLASTRYGVTQPDKNDAGTIVGGSVWLTVKRHVTYAGCSEMLDSLLYQYSN
jgi:hypothetical protein